MPRQPLRGTVASVNDPDKGEVQCWQFSQADYPFLDIFWTMCIFFAWVIWIWLLILVLSDNFRRRDHGGFAKAMWTLFVIFLPLLGVLIYMIARPPEDESMMARTAA